MTGLVASAFAFETGMEYQYGRGSVKDALHNALKGFLAVSFFTLVPVEIFTLFVNMQASMTIEITGYGTDFGAVADTILRESSESRFCGITGATNLLLMLFLIIMMGYSVIKVFFANLNRGGILLIQISVGSLYLFSVPHGYTDGFYQWCKQVIGLCLTTFL